MVVVYDHTVQEHHFFSSGTLMASTCDLLGTKIGETAQCGCETPQRRQLPSGESARLLLPTREDFADGLHVDIGV